MAAPENEFGELVRVDPIVVRGSQAAVKVGPITGFASGFQISLVLLTREQDPFNDPFGQRAMAQLAAKGGDLPDDLFRVGVQYPDGRKATSLDHLSRMIDRAKDFDWEAEPSEPVMVPSGGGGGGRWQMDYWVWPVPPVSGDLNMVIEWPAKGIELTQAAIPASAVVAACEASKPVW